MKGIVFKKNNLSHRNLLDIFGKSLEFLFKIGICVGLKDFWHAEGAQTGGTLESFLFVFSAMQTHQPQLPQALNEALHVPFQSLSIFSEVKLQPLLSHE